MAEEILYDRLSFGGDNVKLKFVKAVYLGDKILYPTVSKKTKGPFQIDPVDYYNPFSLYVNNGDYHWEITYMHLSFVIPGTSLPPYTGTTQGPWLFKKDGDSIYAYISNDKIVFDAFLPKGTPGARIYREGPNLKITIPTNFNIVGSTDDEVTLDVYDRWDPFQQ